MYITNRLLRKSPISRSIQSPRGESDVAARYIPRSTRDYASLSRFAPRAARTATRSLKTLGSQLGLRPFSYTGNQSWFPDPLRLSDSRQIKVRKKTAGRAAFFRVEPEGRIGLPTSFLPRKRSTTELLRRATSRI
jgi:hypothetical protein